MPRPLPQSLKGGWEGSLRGGWGNCVPPALPSTYSSPRFYHETALGGGAQTSGEYMAATLAGGTTKVPAHTARA